MTDYLDRVTDFDDPQVASVFDEMSYWASKFAGMIFDHVELLPNIRGLDLACGTGCPLFELAHMHGTSCDFTGADISDAALARAAAKQAVYQLPNVRLVKLSGETFPFLDDHFDLITSNLGLNNFEHPKTVLAECARVAKKGARLIATTNIKGHMHEFYAIYRGLLSDIGNPVYLERLTANEDHRGTRESHTRLIEEAGFEIRQVVEDTFTLRYMDGSAMLRHSMARFGFLNGWRGVVDPQDERAIFSTLEARLNALSAERGDLSVTIPMLYIEAIRLS